MEKIREILYKMNIYYFIIIIFFIIINNLNEVSNENSKIYGNALILFLSCYWGYSIFKKNRREDLNNKVFKIFEKVYEISLEKTKKDTYNAIMLFISRSL